MRRWNQRPFPPSSQASGKRELHSHAAEVANICLASFLLLAEHLALIKDTHVWTVVQGTGCAGTEPFVMHPLLMVPFLPEKTQITSVDDGSSSFLLHGLLWRKDQFGSVDL